MSDITSFMTTDHRDCDNAFVDFENVISEGNWTDLRLRWDAFAQKLRHHFDMEESVLFPSFESATGISGGPTAVMRSEHQQMRELMSEIEYALEHQDEDQCLGVAETLMLMMQQHNMKEEQMLYPMADQHTDAASVVTAMQGVE